MATSKSAAITQYIDEYMLVFQNREKLLYNAVTNKAIIKGNTATFVLSSSSDSAVTRGINSLFPYSSPDMEQISVTLKEWAAPIETSGFNIFQSQSDIRMMMYDEAMGKINKKIDELIIAELDTATNTNTTAVVGTLEGFLAAEAKLRALFSGTGSVIALISPRYWSYLRSTAAFTNINFAPRKPFESTGLGNTFQWGGIDFIVHPALTGVGTATEKCYIYNKSAIGFAIDSGGEKVNMGVEEKQDLTWIKHSVICGAKLLQQAGVYQILHVGT